MSAKKYPNAAARVAAFRARHALVTLSVDIPKDLVDGLEAYMRFKNLTKSSVIAKLIRDQLLRKR
jgi:metal-responsive CopG/Arc/MetJ family transcriptional regulator